MKNHIRLFFTLIALVATTQATAFINSPGQLQFKAGQDIIPTHNTIKSVSLRMNLGDDLYGIVVSKVCSFCRTIKFTVTPNTIAYNNNVKVPLEEAKSRIGRYATIIYDLKTNNVSAIRW